MAARAITPSPFGSASSERATMARGLAALFAAGATLVALSVLAADVRGSDQTALLVVSALAYATAAGLWVAGEGAAPWILQVAVAAGTALITTCVLHGGAASTAYSFMYIWVALYVAYFFTPAQAAAHMAACIAAAGGALVLSDDVSVPGVHILMLVGTLGMGAALISELAVAARVRAADLAVVAQMGAVADVAEFARAVCDGLRRSTAADVVVLLEPLPRGGGLQVTGMAGTAQSGLLLNAPGALRAIEEAYRSGDVQVLHRDSQGLLGGTQLGLAQPVLRDGEACGVLALAWLRPRRRIGERIGTAALIFAAEASVALERQHAVTREQERRALEINDTIVQGLVVAKYAVSAGQTDQALRAIEDTLGRARRLITEQLDDARGSTGEIRPGDLVRDRASEL